MPLLHFGSVSAQFQKDGLKNKINRMHNPIAVYYYYYYYNKFAHTNKYR
jgi:hypothetical protein